MGSFIKSVIILLVFGVPVAIILMRILFKNSVFKQIGIIWIITLLFTSINNSARIQFESYPQALALPIGIIVGGVGIYLASKFVRTPLNEMINDVLKLSRGKIGAEISDRFSSRTDEIGILAKSVNSLSLNLTKMINEVQRNSIELGSISSDLNEIMKTLINNSSSQSTSVEEISATMEEIATAIQQNSEDSKRTEDISIKTIKAIQAGNKSTLLSIEAMKEVAGKVDVINDIAFQTNILALNAAVEASHAGDAGKGFGVVASEVKKLAEKSNKAAEEVETVSNKVLEMSKNSGTQLHEIVKDANLTADLIKNISAASVEQNSSIQQINYAIQTLNKMIQNNSSEVEKINSKADALSQSSQKLINSVSSFSLNEN